MKAKLTRLNFSISRWRINTKISENIERDILVKAKAYKSGSKKCMLCLTEKPYNIL